MGIYGGLKPEDAARWGQFTTFKINSAELARQELRHHQIIYCSPLVDPYQPAEAERPLMPELLQAVGNHPPRAFVIQTRGPLILRDLPLLLSLASVTQLRISFSITTNRDDVRRRYEPHCESNQTRLQVIAALRRAGLVAYATLAPILPCHPEILARQAIEASGLDLIGDPLHSRERKRRGATSRAAALAIAEHNAEQQWFSPLFQDQVVHRIASEAGAHGKAFVTGPEGFGLLAK